MDYQKNIITSGKTIYDTETTSNMSLYIPIDVLEAMLNNGLIGLSLTGLPLRTRSKFVKSLICKAFGYTVPDAFQKTKPYFPAQNLDVYTQKSNNVQIWNETVDPKRRYAFIQVNESDKILKVKVITGKQLAKLDKTGTLTTKYQAMMPDTDSSMLFSAADTSSVQEWYGKGTIDLSNTNPTDNPNKGSLLPIKNIYEALKILEGISIPYLNALQERNRGALLHKTICEKLGYKMFADAGTYPDILNQLIEIKLQTSPTIDLGLHSPNDNELIFSSGMKQFFSKDIRYAVISGGIKNTNILINHIYMVTGEDFSKHFHLFGGKVQNAKLQIPLPQNFFN
jgi:hypothetical protein